MLPDSCDEIFKTAYANVGLNSDTVWLEGEPDAFRKANQELWVEHHRVNDLYRNNTNNSYYVHCIEEPIRTVRDTIPFSRLAQYGNYVYNEDRERMYAPDNSSTPIKDDCQINSSSDSYEEVWMFPEVEEAFRRLTCVESTDNNVWTQELTPFTPPKQETLDNGKESAQRRLVVFESWASILLTKYPKLASSVRNSQHHSLFSDDDYIPPRRVDPYDLDVFPAPRYNLHTSEELQLLLRVNSSEIRELWSRFTPTTLSSHHLESPSHQRMSQQRPVEQNSYGLGQSLAHRPPPPTLNADVPEFHPKTNVRLSTLSSEDNENGRRYFPSARGVRHQSELFPYAQNNDKHATTEDNSDAGTVTYSTAGISSCPEVLPIFTSTLSADLQKSSQLYSLRQHTPPSSSILCRPPQQWFSTNIQHQVSTLVYTHSQTTMSFSSSSFSHETSAILNTRHASVPRSIPVYQRPPEFYTQQQDTVASGNGAGSRRRQGGGGVDFSNLILLTRGSKSHNRTQNSVRQQINLNQAQVGIPATYDQRCLQPGPVIFGRDLFSDLPLRTVVRQKQELEELENLSRETLSLLHASIGEDVLATDERIDSNDVKVAESVVGTVSGIPCLDHNYPTRNSELRVVNKLIDEFIDAENELKDKKEITKEESETQREVRENVSETLMFVERDHFPPIVAVNPIITSSSTVISELPSLQTTVPCQEISSSQGTSASTSESNQGNALVKRRLYRDVLTNSAAGTAISSPVAPVTDNGIDPRFEELERQALEQYRPSEENLGQRFQQQRTSEESISQRYQELERQAMEQYQCNCSSSSGCNDGCVAEGVNNSNISGGSSGRDASNNVGVSGASQQSLCTGPQHCTPTDVSFLGDDQRLSSPTGGAGSITPSSGGSSTTTPNHTWNRGSGTCGNCSNNNSSSNSSDKREFAGPSSSHLQYELPAPSVISTSTPTAVSSSTCITPNNLTSKNKPAAASKSLPAIGSTLSPIMVPSKQAAASLGAAGDKGGVGMRAISSKSRRRLVLVTPVKKQQPLPSSTEVADTEEGMLGPQLLVVAHGTRGGGQNVGSGQAPRRLVSATFDTQSQPSRSVGGGSTRTERARTSKSHTQQYDKSNSPMARGTGGGGDDKSHSYQRNLDSTTPNVQRTQASEKYHLQSVSNEGGLQQMAASNSMTAKPTSCLEISESWVHDNEDPSHEIHESYSTPDPLQSSTDPELERPSHTKPPPWMTKQRKKRPVTGNKKKRNKSSTKRGSSANKAINESTSSCDLTENQETTILDNLSPNENESNSNGNISKEKITLNSSTLEKQTNLNAIDGHHENDGQVVQDTSAKKIDSKTPIVTNNNSETSVNPNNDNNNDNNDNNNNKNNNSKHRSRTKSHSKLQIKNFLNKSKKTLTDSEVPKDLSKSNVPVSDSKCQQNCNSKRTEDDIKNAEQFIILHFSNEECQFRLKPNCLIPENFHFQLHPGKYFIDNFWHSRTERDISLECSVHIRCYSMYLCDEKKRIPFTRDVTTFYYLTTENLKNMARLNMKHIFREIQKPLFTTRSYLDYERKSKITIFPFDNVKKIVRTSKIGLVSSDEEGIENEVRSLLRLKFLQRSKSDMDIKIAMRNQYIMTFECDLLENSNKINVLGRNYKLKPYLNAQKPNSECLTSTKQNCISKDISAAINWAVNKVSCKTRKIFLQPQKIRKSSSAPSVLTRNNESTQYNLISSPSSLSKIKEIQMDRTALLSADKIVEDSLKKRSSLQATSEKNKKLSYDHIKHLNLGQIPRKTNTVFSNSLSDRGDQSQISDKVTKDCLSLKIQSNEFSSLSKNSAQVNRSLTSFKQLSPPKEYVNLPVMHTDLSVTSEDKDWKSEIQNSSESSSLVYEQEDLTSLESNKGHISSSEFTSNESPLTPINTKLFQDFGMPLKSRRMKLGNTASTCIRQRKFKRPEEVSAESTTKKKQETTCGIQ